MAGWCAEAGVSAQLWGERTIVVLAAYREAAGCHLTLSVVLDTLDSHTALRFMEDYDYLSRPGDPGREYTYIAEVPHAPLEPLLNALEERLGLSPGPGDRVSACFTALVERGELGADLPLHANRDRVAALLARLGAPVTTRDSSW